MSSQLEISPIPTMPCFACGELTNETQSIYGGGHIKCFEKAHAKAAEATFNKKYPEPWRIKTAVAK